MRWITFLILLYLFAAMDVARLGALGGAAVNPRIAFLPLLAIFYALYAAEEHAPLAALICGALMDLLSAEPLGTAAVPLGLVAYGIVRIRLSLFREHLISQLAVTTLAVLAFGVLTMAMRLLLPKLLGVPTTGLSAVETLKAFTFNALYTGVVAPAVFFVLFRFERLLGFTQRGTRQRGRGH